MTNKESNVISLNSVVSNSQLEQVCLVLINLFREELFLTIAPSIQQVIKHLSSRSENGESNSEIMRYMELKHQFEKSKEHIEDSFYKLSTEQFELWIKDVPARLDNLDDELSLVDNRDLEHKLAWQAAAKALSAGEELIKLTDTENRLSVLKKIEPETTPFGPFKICEVMSESLEIITTTPEEAEDILLCFVRELKSPVKKLWLAIDDYLESQGLLKTKPKTSINKIPEQEPVSTSGQFDELPRSASGIDSINRGSGNSITSNSNHPQTREQEMSMGSASSAASASHVTPTDNHQYNHLDEQQLDTIAQKVVSKVEGLFQHQNGVAIDSEGLNSNITVFAAVELASTLTTIQDELSNQHDSLLGLTNSIHTALQERGIKEKVSPRHIDLINIIGMLFEFILDDHELPDEIKHLIGLLQIPILKLALLDENFLSNREHPARQLLNEITLAGMHTVFEPQIKREVVQLIDYTVKTIIKNFLENPDIFPACLESFNLSLKEINDKADERTDEIEDELEECINEKISATTQISKETYQELESLTEHYSIPKALTPFIFELWPLVIESSYDQEESTAQDAAFNALDMLLWNLQAEHLPTVTAEHWLILKNELVDFLNVIETTPSELTKWLEVLNKLIAAPVKADAVTNACPSDKPESELETELSLEPAPEEIVLSSENQTRKYITKPKPADLIHTEDEEEQQDKEFDTPRREAIALNLSIGQWVDFVGKNDQHFRCKLSAIDTKRDLYIFVNNAGVKVSSKRSYQLAHDISLGRVQILDSTPFFDKALNAVMHRFLKF